MLYSADEIAKWFLIRDRSENNKLEISNLKLQKLLYYAQGVYLAITDNPLFKDDIVAWQHGPVVEDIYYEFKDNGSKIICYDPLDNDIDIIKKIEENEEARDTLEFVAEEFGQYTAWKLRNMTHDERPWQVTGRNDVIDNNVIKDYFREEVVEVS
ncbi:putative phage-associated protein [Clostridium sporogenes]|nr:type II toxin-antitoxin system antitoxin SocA domain-containing protein [Clostridium sporogenes]SUY60578.1 putative phage-associated protein [Clostridium sporogenes]